jgi:hypothetical protein
MFAIVDPTCSLESLYPINIFPPKLTTFLRLHSRYWNASKYVLLKARHKWLILTLTRNNRVNSRSTLKKECDSSVIFSTFLFVWHPVVTRTRKENWEVNQNCTSQGLNVLWCLFRLVSKRYGNKAKAETYCIITSNHCKFFCLSVRTAKHIPSIKTAPPSYISEVSRYKDTKTAP